ncbi:hypothetical protein SARC_15518, partial [Sphaeroforma arctica JP610]
NPTIGYAQFDHSQQIAEITNEILRFQNVKYTNLLSFKRLEDYIRYSASFDETEEELRKRNMALSLQLEADSDVGDGQSQDGFMPRKGVGSQ